MVTPGVVAPGTTLNDVAATLRLLPPLGGPPIAMGPPTTTSRHGVGGVTRW